MTNRFADAAPIEGTRITSDGFLVTDARIVRTGIQTYAGWEVGEPTRDTVAVYRPESEVFARDSVASFSHAPLTLNHPDEMVTADNWKDYAVGEVSDEVLRDGERLRIPLIVKDKDAIAQIQAGTRELSAGYTCDLKFEPGQTSDGQQYDAIQTNIRANHVAIVDKGRAGKECRIGDGAHKWGISPITPEKRKIDMSDKLKQMTVDGVPIEVTDQAQAVIEKLTRQLADGAANIEKLTADHKAEIDAKDTELGKLKAENKKLTDAQPDPAQMDKLVADRATLVTTAKTISRDLDVAGLSDANIRKAAVAAKMGDDAVKDASDAEIKGMFAVIAADAKPADKVADALKAGGGKTPTNDNGQAAYEARLTDAWKTPKEA